MGEMDKGQDSQGNVPGNSESVEYSTCLSAWCKTLCNLSCYSEMNYVLTYDDRCVLDMFIRREEGKL